jgi:serine/threonine-protein kinase
LEEPGGIGGMATVYRTLDLALDREVAIKVLKPELSKDAIRAELFLHEARTAATINHYAVIPIYTCGVFEDQPYIVMQYMGGGSLETRLKMARGVLPIAEVVRWMRDVAEGLENARRHGIAHHDIKPGNIMLDADGNAKIGDFGLAYAVNDARSVRIAEMTKTWLSPNYVSPERVINGKEDYLGDVYSLARTFYHLSTGFTPFNHAEVEELVKLRLKNDPQPPHLQRPDLPFNLSHLILAMMDRAPDRRPDYKEIASSLSDYLKALNHKSSAPSVASSKAPSSPEATRIAQAPSEQTPFQDLQASAERPKRVAFSVSLAISAVLALIALALLAYGFGSGRLQGLLPAVKMPTPKIDFDSGVPPSLAAAFAAGDAKAALKNAEAAFSDIEAPAPIRIQAAALLALANYLNDEAQAKENCAFIDERLEAILAAVSSNPEIQTRSAPGKAIVAFLAGNGKGEDDLAKALPKEPGSVRVAGALAVFLKSAKTNAPVKDSLELFAAFEKELASAPQCPWSVVWLQRSKLWAANFERGKSPERQALEPLIYKFAMDIVGAGSSEAAKAAPDLKRKRKDARKADAGAGSRLDAKEPQEGK